MIMRPQPNIPGPRDLNEDGLTASYDGEKITIQRRDAAGVVADNIVLNDDELQALLDFITHCDDAVYEWHDLYLDY